MLESAHVPRRPTSIHSSSHRSVSAIARRVASGWSAGSDAYSTSSIRRSTPRPVEVGLGLEAALLGDHDVELAAPQRRDRLRRVHQRRARPARPGRRCRNADTARGTIVPAAVANEASRSLPRASRGDLGQLGLRVRELGQDPLGVAHQRLAGGRELDALGLALDQLDAGLRLQARDLLGHGGLRVGERLGGGRERAAQRHLAQDLQQAEIIHKVSLSHGSVTII